MKKEYIFISIIFLIVLGTRLFIAYQTPNFSSDEAYFNIRQVEHIKATFLPIIQDDLIKEIIYLPPLFYYLLALLNFIFEMGFIGKFFPNLFASAIVIVAYLISGQLTKNRTAKYFACITAGFMPLFFSETINSLSINSLVLPLIFFILYCMMRIVDNEQRFITFFIPSLLILRLTSPSVIFLIFALLVYLLFIYIEKIKITKTEIELILFSTFLITWSLFVSLKNAFLNYGLAILWQNIPKEILRDYFMNTNLLTIIYFIGLMPFIFGLYAIYKYAFKEKDKKIYLLVSFAVVISFLMWFRLIELKIALMFIGFVMISLFAKSFDFLQNSIKNKNLRLAFTFLCAFLIIISSIIPSLVMAKNSIKKAYSNEEIEAINWLIGHTKGDSRILTTINEGHLITTIAKRKNFIDSNFMFVKDIDQRLKDIYIMYRTTSKTQAINLLNKYEIDYIYFSKRAKEEYNIEHLNYLDENCFEKVFSNKDVEIYKALCIIEEE